MTKARDLANGGFGLVLIKPSSVVNGTDNGKGTVSFSAVSSVSLNDVFSATYTNYKILGFCQSSTTGGTGNIRFRVSGSDDSTTNYNVQELSVQHTSIVGNRSTSSNTLAITGFRQSEDNLFETLICNPFATAKTTVISQVFDPLSGASYYTYSGKFNQTTSFTGFTFSGTNLTGTISIYGYNK